MGRRPSAGEVLAWAFALCILAGVVAVVAWLVRWGFGL